MSEFTAESHATVLDHFGATALDGQSCNPWAPVFRAEVGGQPVAVKRTCEGIGAWARGLAEQGVPVVAPVDLDVPNPADLGGTMWAAYPWIAGRRYDASPADLDSAGDLLGRIHNTSVPEADLTAFRWPDHDPGETLADLDELRSTFEHFAPDQAEHFMAAVEPLGRRFGPEVLPVVRAAGLPVTEVSLDYKANNLVYTDGGPVLVDPDNAERAPRLLDLAMAVLLFHNEEPAAPPRPFDTAEWQAFRGGYLRQVDLTHAERAVWPQALLYTFWEWGTWTITSADDWQWAEDHQRAFLENLTVTDTNQYPL